MGDNKKCELKGCRSELPAEIRVNENLGDASYSTRICETCADILSLSEGGDIPQNATRKIRAAYRPPTQDLQETSTNGE